MISFSLTPHIYAARYENSIIILDARSDNYLSLIDCAAEYLTFTIENSFTYDPEKKWFSNPECANLDQLNYWIDYYTELPLNRLNLVACMNINGILKHHGSLLRIQSIGIFSKRFAFS